ncbi:long-chain fatty acid--CoA ligase [bacterium]|nr:long-chain fatty acid--CoA ligase [bacterium]
MNSRLFLIDRKSDLALSYSEFLSQFTTGPLLFSPYVFTDQLDDIFFQLILGLASGSEVTLLDSDFKPFELESLAGGVDTAERRSVTLRVTPDHLTDLADMLVNATGKVSLFTSGTTGLPKKIQHLISSLCRQVRVSARHSSDVWGLAYNPTHIAGLQVFFQAFFNQNPLVNLFDRAPAESFELIQRYAITHISATPTFFRLVLSAAVPCPTVQRITLGGEKFDPGLESDLRRTFPNAVMTNVYASTEAGALFAASGDVFQLNAEFDGKVKVNGESLMIHFTLLGGYSPELKLDDGWYDTGDVVEVLSESPLTFRIKFRNNESVNVGGYKVNPHEVVAVLQSHPKVRAASVYGKKNSVVGTILCCDIVADDPPPSEKELRLFLQDRLQGFKIPRLFQFVPFLEITRTGKLKTP